MTIKSDVMQQMVNGSLAQATKPVKVVDVELVLSDKQLALLGEAVNNTMRADELLFDGNELKDNVAKAVAKVLQPDAKVPCTFAYWDFVATTFQKVYMSRNKLSNEKSAENVWYDVAKRMKAKFALEKPTKDTKDSTRMSEKRKAELAELQKKTDSVLRDEVLAYKAEDTKASLAKASKLLAEIERRGKLANAGIAEQIKARQALLAKAVRKIENPDLLAQLWDLVPQSIKLDIAQDK